MSIWLTNLADVLKNAGLPVVELPNWKTAAFPKWGGFETPPSHVMIHHTASGPKSDPEGDLDYITNVHPLKPICNLYLSRSGTFYVVAAGRVCTNGTGSSVPWNGGVPDNMMNHHAISIEAANLGNGEPWPTIQIKSYVKGVAALCKGFSIPVKYVRGHFEWAPGRKIDPAGASPYATGGNKWDMDKFRRDVGAALLPAPIPPIPPTPTPTPPQEDDVKTLVPQHRNDTRKTTPMKAGEIRKFPVMYGGSAVMVNITVIPLDGKSGYLKAWGAGPAPGHSNLSYSGKDGNVANLALVPTFDGGWINVWVSTECHVVIDTQGYLL